MKKDDLIYVGHMLDQARRALEKTQGVLREEFDADENLRLALTHLLQTIGEAARRVSAEFQLQHPDMPWSGIIGMRHKVVHDYLHVNYNIVWNAVADDLPPLVAQLEKILPGQ